jgi:DNA topoisomerase IA
MKTLVVAEKPSVARDLADALPGSFAKEETHYESDDPIVTFAVGCESSTTVKVAVVRFSDTVKPLVGVTVTPGLGPICMRWP